MVEADSGKTNLSNKQICVWEIWTGLGKGWTLTLIMSMYYADTPLRML